MGDEGVIVPEELRGKVWRTEKFRKTCLVGLENRVQFVRGVGKREFLNSFVFFFNSDTMSLFEYSTNMGCLNVLYESS